MGGGHAEGALRFAARDAYGSEEEDLLTPYPRVCTLG